MKAHFGIAARTLVQLAAFCGLGLGLNGPARAVDGCTLLLCMAGNWMSIGQCVPTVRQALRDLLRGRAWPTCSMVGDSGSANQHVAPEQCPEQYKTVTGVDYFDRAIYGCPFRGVIHIAVGRQPWSRTWWSESGDSVVEWLPAAKAAFAGLPGAMDDRFDRDHAAWVISQQARPAAEPAAAGAGSGSGGGG